MMRPTASGLPSITMCYIQITIRRRSNCSQSWPRGGPALELGIGTGPVALPLHKKGVSVQGIDASEAMLSKLRSKPLGDEIEVQIGSFGGFKIEQSFKLIYAVFSTFFGLRMQEEQVRCFKTVREHLSPDGVFLLEVFIPDLRWYTDQGTVRTVNIAERSVSLNVS